MIYIFSNTILFVLGKSMYILNSSLSFSWDIAVISHGRPIIKEGFDLDTVLHFLSMGFAEEPFGVSGSTTSLDI